MRPPCEGCLSVLPRIVHLVDREYHASSSARTSYRHVTTNLQNLRFWCNSMEIRVISAVSCNLIGLVMRKLAMRSLMRSLGAALMQLICAHAILNSLLFSFLRGEMDDMGCLAHHKLVLIRPHIIYSRKIINTRRTFTLRRTALCSTCVKSRISHQISYNVAPWSLRAIS